MGLADDARAALDSFMHSVQRIIDEQMQESSPWRRFDPESPKIQKDIEDWGSKTTFGILAGMLYGGIREGYASAHWQPLLPSQAGSRTWNERQQLWKNMWEQRMLRVAGGTVRGAAKLGTFTGMFCGVQKGLEIYRGKNDTLNTVGAACSTAAVLGLAFPGSLRWRLRTSLLGAFVGGILGFPLGSFVVRVSPLYMFLLAGYLHSLATQLEEEQPPVSMSSTS